MVYSQMFLTVLTNADFFVKAVGNLNDYNVHNNFHEASPFQIHYLKIDYKHFTYDNKYTMHANYYFYNTHLFQHSYESN